MENVVDSNEEEKLVEEIEPEPDIVSEKLEQLIDLIVEQTENEKKEKEEQEKQLLEQQKTEEELQQQLESEKENESELQDELLQKDETYKEELLTVMENISSTGEESAEGFQELILKMDEIIENQQLVLEQLIEPTPTDNVVYLYGTIVIPAAIIIFALWRLIKPFIP